MPNHLVASQSQADWSGPDGVVHRGEVIVMVNGFKVIRCIHCQFKHVVPLPSPDELRSVYSHEYYSTEKPLYIERYLEDKPWWDGVYALRYEQLEQHLPDDRRRLLDVGSGPGLFMLAGRERGWQVRGIEPSAQAVGYSRSMFGLDITECFLTHETASTLGRFDALNLGEVLEHLPDPAAMLGLASELLDDDGLLCLVVPNDFNPFQTVLLKQACFPPWWVAPPHHLNYFDARSLQALVERCGFEVLHVESTFPIDLFLLMGHNYIGNDALGRQAHGMRKQFEQTLYAAGAGELQSALYSALSKLGLGREVVLFARKTN